MQRRDRAEVPLVEGENAPGVEACREDDDGEVGESDTEVGVAAVEVGDELVGGITDGAMELDPNFRGFIASLRAHDARFLVVGGYAVGLHGHPRYTADLDIWVLVDDRNTQALLGALQDFGFGDMGLRAEDFLEPDRVVQLGYPPLRIDLMTSIDGVDIVRRGRSVRSQPADQVPGMLSRPRGRPPRSWS